MKIKLHTKLAAYSRVASIDSKVPTPTSADAGKLLGVNASGQYEFISDVDNSQIDNLFDAEDLKSSSSFIDSLFKGGK